MSEQTAKRRFLTWKTARRVAIGLVILGAICFTAVMLWVAALLRVTVGGVGTSLSAMRR